MKRRREINHGNVFDFTKPIYEFQKDNFAIVLFIGLLWILFVLFIFINSNENIIDEIQIIFMMLLPGVFIIIMGVKNKNKISKYNEMCSYIIKNGCKFNGKVKEILEVKHEHYRGGDTKFPYTKKHKYLLIEYNDETLGIKGVYVTPELYQTPKKEDIKCDIYMLLEELPNKYKRIKLENQSHPYKKYNDNNIVIDKFR